MDAHDGIRPVARTLRTQARDIFRHELLSGRVRPGEKINEARLATQMGVSRGTLREALRNLEQEGLLVSIPHRGLFARRFSPREAAELQETRLSLEVTAACRLASRWTGETEALLNDRLAVLQVAYESGAPFPERLGADLGFHEGICESCDNAILYELWKSLIGNITVMALSVGSEQMTKLQDPEAHRVLITAIASGDDGTIRESFTAHFAAGQPIINQAVIDSLKSVND